MRLFPQRLGLMPYVYLLFFAYPIWFIAQDEQGRYWQGGLALTLFFVCYRQAFFTERNEHWLVGQFATMVFLMINYSPIMVSVGIYTSAQIAFAQRSYLYSFIASIAVALAIHPPRTYEWFYVGVMAAFAISLAIGIRKEQEAAQMKVELDDAKTMLHIYAQREERERIARDLHDSLGHTLALLALKAELVEKLIDKKPEFAAREARELKETVRQSLQRVREVVANTRTLTLAAQKEEVTDLLRAANVTYEMSGEWANVPPIVEHTFSFCLCETVTNIIKHSGATFCRIEFGERNGHFVLCVYDNGRGVTKAVHDGNGVRGMRERAAFFGGSFTLERKEAETVATCSIPKIVKQGG